MRDYEREWVEETRQNAGKLASYLDKGAVEKLLLVYELDDDAKDDIRHEVDSLISPFAHELSFSRKPLLECPDRDESAGEIAIGRIQQGERLLWEFRITREELNQHMLITARSGAGKTTLVRQIARQCMEKEIPFIILDYKLDYRHLIRLYPRLLVLNWKKLRINPLEPPPGVSFQEWKQQFLNLFGHVEGIWQGSTQYLLKAVDEAYQDKKGLPSIEDVYRKVAGSYENSRKMQEYSSVVETRLYGLLSKLGRTINNERNTIDVEKLLRMPVVFELHGLARDEASILVLWLFYWIYAYRRAQGVRGKLLHVLIVDEAKRVWSASEQYSQTTAEYSGVPPADLVCDEIRDFGEAIVACDQEPSKLSQSLKANTYAKLTGFLGNGRDINEAAEAMDLNEEEREAITRLERGEWLVKLAGRYTQPFIVRSDDFPLEKNVTDSEVEERLIALLGLHPDEEKQAEKPDLELSVRVPQVSEQAFMLLKHALEHPFTGCVSRYKALGFSGTRSQVIKNELVAKKLVVEVEIPLDGHKPVKFLTLTPAAINMMKAIGHDTRLWLHTGQMGFRHQLYLVLLSFSMEKQGWTVTREKTLGNGRRVDIYTVRDGHRVAIEVELGDFNLDWELTALEEADEVLIVTESHRPDIVEDGKIKVRRVADLLSRLRSNNIINYKELISINHNILDSNVFSGNNREIKENNQNV